MLKVISIVALLVKLSNSNTCHVPVHAHVNWAKLYQTILISQTQLNLPTLNVPEYARLVVAQIFATWVIVNTHVLSSLYIFTLSASSVIVTFTSSLSGLNEAFQDKLNILCSLTVTELQVWVYSHIESVNVMSHVLAVTKLAVTSTGTFTLNSQKFISYSHNQVDENTVCPETVGFNSNTKSNIKQKSPFKVTKGHVAPLTIAHLPDRQT